MARTVPSGSGIPAGDHRASLRLPVISLVTCPAASTVVRVENGTATYPPGDWPRGPAKVRPGRWSWGGLGGKRTEDGMSRAMPTGPGPATSHVFVAGS